MLLIATIVAVAYSKRKYKHATLQMIFKRYLGKVVAALFHYTGFLPIPRSISGKGKALQMGSILKELGCKKPLIVTDAMLVKHGLVKPTTDSLTAAGFEHQIYDKVIPNPPSDLVEEGHQVYENGGCDSIVAFGGGSPMDVAKIIGAKIANPKDVEAYQGFFRVSTLRLRSLPPLIAVPTTAGTGSETTAVAVITMEKENKKIAIVDMGLVPRIAVLDPELLVKLPKTVTSATGMDALTHAVESYVGGWTMPYTREKSLLAVAKIFKHLKTAYQDASNLEVNESMLNAAYEAGLAFTRANVGYVHAIAHQFGGMFHTPHGVANAMLLPHLLSFYLEGESEGSTIIDSFCQLAVAGAIVSHYDTNDASAKHSLAQQFVKHVEQMNADMCIPQEVKEMKASHVDEVAMRALGEAHGDQHSLLDAPLRAILDLGYPVPKYMTLTQCKSIIAKCLTEEEKHKWDALSK